MENEERQASLENERLQAYLVKLKTDLLEFGRLINPGMFFKASPEFHRVLADALLSKQRFLNIIAPRGTAKSSLAAEILVLHHFLFDEGPKVIVIASKTVGHSVNRLQSIKDVLEYSESFRNAFGYWGRFSARKWQETEVVLRDGTYIIAKGTGQQIRGLKYGNQRPTLIVVDDPEDENNTKTKEAMEHNLKWLLQSTLPSLDADRGRCIVIGTPQHEACMVFTLKEMSSWQTLQFKYLNEDDGRMWSLWPEMRSVEALINERNEYQSIGKIAYWYRERQCEVIPGSEQMFKPEYLKYWDGELVIKAEGAFLHIKNLNGVETDQLLAVNVFMGVDPASTTTDRSDFTAIVAVAYDAHRRRFVLPYDNLRLQPLDVKKRIVMRHREYMPMRTRVESNGYQEMLRASLVEEEGLRGIVAKETARDSKDKRLEALQPFFAEGSVYIKDGMEELKSQLFAYPKSKHDDLMDALWYACKGNFPPMHDLSKEDHEFYALRRYRRQAHVDGWVVA